MTGLIILKWIDCLLFIYFGLSVFYLFLFALFSRKKGGSYPESTVFSRIVVLFPAYCEDVVIEDSVRSFLQQNYPRNRYEVVVISDHLQESTNQQLSQLPISLFRVDFEHSSKAKALNYAIEQLQDKPFDMVAILDADNTVESDFLRKINDAFQAGAMAIQCHRTARNKNTDIAVLDAASEEMNNAYFRKGHVRMGLSSALSGSGMAFDYSWFCQNITKISSSGEDKELEMLLLKQEIYIEYLDKVPVYDEKISTSDGFYKQRQRWLASQFGILKKALHDLPEIFRNKNIDYADKVLQWMFLPRVLLLGFIGLFAVLLLFLDWKWTVKWWGLLFFLFFTFALAIPKEMDNKQLEKAVKKVPLLFFLMFINLFRLKGMNKKFTHTKHGNA